MLILSNAEQIIYATVYIEVQSPFGHAAGTGFFGAFRLPNGGNAIALVSCRHLLEGASSVRYWCNIASRDGCPSGRFADITVQLDGGATSHPDLNVDLSAFIVHHVENQAFLKGERLFFRSIPDSLIPAESNWETVCIGDEIYVAGCPSEQRDSVDNSAFLRKGIIASLPRDGRSHFFIDCPTIEGSSGSPIFIDSHVSFNRTKGQYEIGSRFFLVGVVTGGLEEITDDGRIDLHFGKAARSDALPMLYKEILNNAGQ